MAKKFEESPKETLPKSFCEFYNGVCNRIRSTGILDDVMNEFQKFRSDLERVEYVAKMEDVQSLFITEVEGKNAEKARILDNEYDGFIVNEMHASKAKFAISKSIQATPNEDKESLAIRYMKRGWASLLQEQFEQALLDAQRCLSFKVPSSLVWNAYEIIGHCYAKENLNKKSEVFFKQALDGLRNSECPKEMKAKVTLRISTVFKNVKGRKDGKGKKTEPKDTEKGKRNLPNVSYGQHKVLESATNAVEVLETKEMGRSVFATKEIKPGDFIIVEEPFAAILNYDRLDTHCFNCFQRLDTPLPCPSCSLVWFCNETCRNEGNTGLHSHECKLLSLLYDECLGKMALLAFRILQTATWKKLKLLRDLNSVLLLDNIPDMEMAPMKSVWQWKRKKYSTADYLSTFHLSTNDTKRSFGDLLKRSLAAIYIVSCLKTTDFFDADATDEDIIYAASLALRHFQGSSCNAYAINEYITRGNSQENAETRELGGAIYPTVSLTNHSCWPNVLRYNIGTTCVLRAMRTIEKGTEVLDNYGPEFHVWSLRERQKLLQSQYKFDCKCSACVDDWPTYPHRQEPFTFACPQRSCNRPSSYLGGTKTQCTHCGNSDSHNTLVKDIKVHLNEFGKGLFILNRGNVNKALPVLLNHQIFLDKYVIPPGKCLTDSQESIKRCFLSEGNLLILKE